MKYKLAFVNELKDYIHTFWYKDELYVLMKKHNMLDEYNKKIRPVNMQRWFPEQVFSCLEKE